jgi:hypothetical protein
VLRGSGTPLAAPLKEEMEARLGADLSDVRVHTGGAAHVSAAEVDARAYASGSHIVIGDGGADKHTLAHELTHVIQQRHGPVAGTDHGSGFKVSDPFDLYEQAAEANAARVMRAPLSQHHLAAEVDEAVSRPKAPLAATAVLQRAKGEKRKRSSSETTQSSAEEETPEAEKAETPEAEKEETPEPKEPKLSKEEEGPETESPDKEEASEAELAEFRKINAKVKAIPYIRKVAEQGRPGAARQLVGVWNASNHRFKQISDDDLSDFMPTTTGPPSTAGINFDNIWTVGPFPTGTDNAWDHFGKHGRELGKGTPEEYVRAAQDVRKKPNFGYSQQGQGLKNQYVRLDLSTVAAGPENWQGELVVEDSLGKIASYYKLDNISALNNGYKSVLDQLYYLDTGREKPTKTALNEYAETVLSNIKK